MNYKHLYFKPHNFILAWHEIATLKPLEKCNYVPHPPSTSIYDDQHCAHKELTRMSLIFSEQDFVCRE